MEARSEPQKDRTRTTGPKVQQHSLRPLQMPGNLLDLNGNGAQRARCVRRRLLRHLGIGPRQWSEAGGLPDALYCAALTLDQENLELLSRKHNHGGYELPLGVCLWGRPPALPRGQYPPKCAATQVADDMTGKSVIPCATVYGNRK